MLWGGKKSKSIKAKIYHVTMAASAFVFLSGWLRDGQCFLSLQDIIRTYSRVLYHTVCVSYAYIQEREDLFPCFVFERAGARTIKEGTRYLVGRDHIIRIYDTIYFKLCVKKEKGASEECLKDSLSLI